MSDTPFSDTPFSDTSLPDESFIAAEMSHTELLLQKLGCEWSHGKMFVLPEVWDVACARVLCDLGFPAIATSASAMAWANGYRPLERVKLEDLLLLAARIYRDTKKTIIADIEGCFERGNDNIKKATEAALHVGCRGIIIGDGSRDGLHEMQPIDQIANRIKTARVGALAAKKPLVIIARTDVFHMGRLMAMPVFEAEKRAKAYFNAGADLVHFPGVQHLKIIHHLSRVAKGPIGITITHKGAANLDSYHKLGVAAVMLGTGLMRSALTDMQLKAASFLESGAAVHLDDAMSATEAEQLFRPSMFQSK